MNSANNSIRHILRQAYQQLVEYSTSPNLDAEILLAHVLQIERAQLLALSDQSLSTRHQQQFDHLITRRQQSEPIAYLLGYREFWSLRLKVTVDTLIPRPETELLVEQVLQKLPAQALCRVADLGTGCGAIALAIANERPNWLLVATDSSSSALEIAQQNANALQLTQVSFRQGDWCKVLAAAETFHAIVSNPPYIDATDTQLQPSVRRFEPLQALLAGNKGLQALHDIIVQARFHLCPCGWLLLEHGYNQASEVKKLLAANHYTTITCYSDLAGWERVTAAQFTGQL